MTARSKLFPALANIYTPLEENKKFSMLKVQLYCMSAAMYYYVKALSHQPLLSISDTHTGNKGRLFERKFSSVCKALHCKADKVACPSLIL